MNRIAELSVLLAAFGPFVLFTASTIVRSNPARVKIMGDDDAGKREKKRIKIGWQSLRFRLISETGTLR